MHGGAGDGPVASGKIDRASFGLVGEWPHSRSRSHLDLGLVLGQSCSDMRDIAMFDHVVLRIRVVDNVSMACTLVPGINTDKNVSKRWQGEGLAVLV